MTKEIGWRIIVLLCLVSLIFFLLIPNQNQPSNFLLVSFLDVGQGDAIYIKTPDGFEVLIDGGATNQVLRELAARKSFFDKDIDLVVATHADADHIGGLVDVLSRYEIDNILVSQNSHDTSITKSFDSAVEIEGAVVHVAQAGQQIKLGASTTLKIFSPMGDSSNWPSNSTSIVLQVIYGETEFMLTGDAPSGVEDYLVKTNGGYLESDVLKLGHHGSKTSSSELFLDTVNPGLAIVSAGIDNRYGHPHQEVISMVEARNIEILSTAIVGSIDLLSDGQKVWLNE